MEISSRRKVFRYLAVTGLLSVVLLGIAFLLGKEKAPLAVQIIANCLSAWGPTFAVLVLFRKLYPGQRLGEFLKGNFSVRINPLTFVLIFCLQVGIFAFAVAAYLWMHGKGLHSLALVSLPEAILLLITQMLSGAMGEELGWRGYLLRDFEKRHSLLVSALLVGIVWGFWHLPVWFTLGYTGTDLVRYIVFFLVEILSFSIIMAVFYHHHANLFIPIWIHFLINFLVGLVKIDLLNLMGWMALGYSLLAIVLIVVEQKSAFGSNSI
jgi:membrane protease YdiL (CAAX protease family)